MVFVYKTYLGVALCLQIKPHSTRKFTTYHTVVNHFVGEFASANGIESLWAVLKRGFNGTYYHFSKKYMDRYVNEFSFRLSEGNVKLHTMERIDNFCKVAFDARITYRGLVVDE